VTSEPIDQDDQDDDDQDAELTIEVVDEPAEDDELTDQDDHDDDDQAPDEPAEDDPWSGEPIFLQHDQDRFWLGLVNRVHLPGSHVHPKVRQAAEAVQAAQAARNALGVEMAERGPERERLVAKLGKRAQRSGADRTAAARSLQRFDAESELVRTFVGPADQAITESWQGLGAAVHVYAGEWDQELREAGQEAAGRLKEAALAVQTEMAECALIDALLARERICSRQPETGPEIRAAFDRNQRGQSITALLAGRDLGAEGVQHGLGSLAWEFAAAFLPPEPVEPEPEPEPIAVVHRKQDMGLLPRRLDRFMISDG
jgi:hypothetical protein